MLSPLAPTEMAKQALRLIGVFSINDSAPDPAALDEALFWLDMNVTELAGKQSCRWLVPATVEVPLQADKATYNLDTDATSGTGSRYGVQFPISAWVLESNGRRDPIDIIRRNDYESLDDHTTPGKPDRVLILRQRPSASASATIPDAPTATIWPVPSTDQGPYTLELTVQSYSPDFVGECTEDPTFLLGAAWTRWAIYATAADCARGAVRKLPEAESDRLSNIAAAARIELNAYENRQHATRRQVAFQDLG